MATKRAPHKTICPGCERPTIAGKFDATFRDPDGPRKEERSLFAIPASLCQPCAQLYVDRDLIDLLGIGKMRCVFAIMSDQGVRP